MTGSSGESTPARETSVTPTPQTASSGVAEAAATAGPSPLTVGTRFVKQYYKTLSSTPEQIRRFYQPSSVLSVGVGSAAAAPATFETISAELNDRFKPLDDSCNLEKSLIRFEFENGAIDAQQSVDNSILLVVTGHTVYLSPDNESEILARKAFVHTFFLGSISAGSKVSYYVHNDVLRFLNQTGEESIEAKVENGAVQSENPAEELIVGADSNGHSKQKSLSNNKADAEQKSSEPIASTQTEKKGDTDLAPGGGVEESKEVMLEEADTGGDEEDAEDEELKSEEEEKPTKPDEKGGASTAKDNPTDEKPAENVETLKESVIEGKKTEETTKPSEKDDVADASTKPVTSTKGKQAVAKPGSWASLVAGSAVLVSGPSTPNRAASQASAKPSPPPSASVVATKTAQPTIVATKTSQPATVVTKTAQPTIVATKTAQPTTVATKTTQPTTVDSSKTNVVVDNISAQPENVTKQDADTELPTTTNSTSFEMINSKQNQNQPKVVDQNQPKVVGNDTYRRDPDSTLVIRNIPFEALDKDIMGIFEKFATDIGGKVIRCTVNADHGIAFMDYDSPDPVLSAIAVHKEDPFYLMGRELRIYQKIVVQNNQQKNHNQNPKNSSRSGGRLGNKSSGGRAGDNAGDGDSGGRTSLRSGGGRGDRGGGDRGGYRPPFRNPGEGRGANDRGSAGGRGGRAGGR